MVEDQVMMKLSGALEHPDRVVSCRGGRTRYRRGEPGTQRCRSMPADEARIQQAWRLDRTVREKLTRFVDMGAHIELQIMSRARRVRSGNEEETSSFAAFWGRLAVEGAWPSVFGSDAEGDLVFRRGPWEDWPFDAPRFEKVDPGVPILLSPYCGTLFHEAVGHALEAEYLDMSPFKYRFGECISHESLYIADRPDLVGYPGSMVHDDTGRVASATTLVHHGHLVGDLARDRGTWRRASYRELPQVRASNFIIKGGTDHPDLWRHDLPRCYYVAWIQSGSWQPGTHRIKILTGPIFLLEHGRVEGVRDWARLEMSSSDLLQRVAGVGNDFAMDPAVHWCVKKNQAVPMGMGAPSILIEGRG